MFLVLALGLGPGGPAGAVETDARLEHQAAPAQSGSPAEGGPAIGARSAILVDALDGTILWEKDPRRRRAVASTVKILTALVVLERARPDDIVTASPRAQAVGDSDTLVTELDLAAGERLTVEQLLYGLMLPSANDAAVALAEHVGGSMERFAGLMNSKARQLGATDSNFTNANGLDDPEQYSSAYDLALFSRAAMQVPLFRKIVATRNHAIPKAGRPGGRALQNRNQLLAAFPGATGIKTGQTLAAGKSLVAAARRDGEERIAVILASPDPVAESRSVLEYGLSGFRRFRMAEKSRKWGQITYGDGTSARLVALRSAGVLLPAGRPDPRVSYDPRRKVLTANAGRKLTVPVRVECMGRGCRVPPGRQPRLMPAVFSVLAPILALTR